MPEFVVEHFLGLCALGLAVIAFVMICVAAQPPYGGILTTPGY
ncbi:MAG TPA: hypothetical protein VH371_09390 [Candidatus Limnocylindrales bacterium]